MNTATDTTNALRTRAIADAMTFARNVICDLEALGITVFAVTASDRRPTLFIDRMPDGVVCVTKRSSPTGTGREVIRATQWRGCQLQTMHVETFAPRLQFAEGTDAIRVAPHLQVVPRD